MSNTAATLLPPPATEVLSTVLVDVQLAEANWAECRDITIAHVRAQAARIAALEAAAAELAVAVDACEVDGSPEQLRRLQRAQTALLVVLP